MYYYKKQQRFGPLTFIAVSCNNTFLYLAWTDSVRDVIFYWLDSTSLLECFSYASRWTMTSGGRAVLGGVPEAWIRIQKGTEIK